VYNLSFYVPILHCDTVKNAVFEAGAGQAGNYKNCSWQTLGEGQFHPTEGSKPFRGREGQLETMGEYRVEMMCRDPYIRNAVAALKESHPYEVPAYTVTRVEELF
jgi:hypothetical protein